MTNTDLLQNRSVMSVHILNVCLLETLSGVVQCFSQLRPPMRNQMSSPQYHMVEKLFIFQGMGWGREGRKGRREGREGREDREGGRVVLQSVVSPTQLIT